MTSAFQICFARTAAILISCEGRVTSNVMSRNIRSVDVHVFRTDLRDVLESTTQSDSADPLCVYNTCLRQLLDHHALLLLAQ